MYLNSQAVVLVNGRRSEAFAIERSNRQGCSLSPLLYLLTLEPLVCRLWNEKASPALHGIPFDGSLSAKVSAYADDINVFVSCRLDIKPVKNAVAKYEQIEGAKINFVKSEGLRLGAWRGGVPLSGTFRWSDGPIRILGCGSSPASNWSEVGRKYKVDPLVGAWFRRRLSLKDRA